MLVFKNVVSVSDISAVNLIVGLCLFAYTMNLLILSLLTFQSEKVMKRFQTSGFITLWLRMSVSSFAMKMLENVGYGLHTVWFPSSCGIFVYRLVTSIQTSNAFTGTLVLSMKLMKVVVYFRSASVAVQ